MPDTAREILEAFQEAGTQEEKESLFDDLVADIKGDVGAVMDLPGAEDLSFEEFKKLLDYWREAHK
jgi:hypothetical protein